VNTIVEYTHIPYAFLVNLHSLLALLFLDCSYKYKHTVAQIITRVKRPGREVDHSPPPSAEV